MVDSKFDHVAMNDNRRSSVFFQISQLLDEILYHGYIWSRKVFGHENFHVYFF